MIFFRQLYAILAKELAVEWRTREAISAMLVFGLLVLVIFNFAFDLQGVDIKVLDDKPYVVDVNDNPNIDAGVEDTVLKDNLYETIMDEFVNRIDRLKMRKDQVSPSDALKLLTLRA